MSIEVSCVCGKRFRARDEWAGRRVACPSCRATISIPRLEQHALDKSNVYALAGSAAPPRPVRSQPAPPPLPAVSAIATPASTPTRSQRSGYSNWIYLALILTMVPLVWSTFHSRQDDFDARLSRTLRSNPQVLQRAENREFDSLAELIEALPTHRLEGAMLEQGSGMHWLFALVAAGAFFGVALLTLPKASTRSLHVFYTGLFTGTAGVLLLLVVQFIANHMRGHIYIPRSVIGLVFLILKGIQLSYDAANDPTNNFFLSALGFTFGVGLCEELCKALPVLWHYRTRERRMDWRGACRWGFLSGVGFGLSEAIMYSSDHYNGLYGGEIYLVRFVSCVGLHGIWAAAAGIFICKRQELLQGAETWLHIFFVSVLLVSVPMVLHGMYDTMLKKDMNAAAMVVALVSFGWLVYQVEEARRKEAVASLSYA